MTKCLFFDIDGTLVNTPEETYMRQSIIDAIATLRKKGHLCFIASGRNFGGCRKYMDYFDGVIFSDGAGVMFRDELIYSHPIPREIALQHIEMVHHQFNGTVLVATKDYTYCDELEYNLYLSIDGSEELMKEYNFIPLKEIPQEEIYEMDTMFPNREMEAQFEKAKPKELHYISTTASYGRGEATSGEVTCTGVTKGNGILQVIKALHLNIEDTYAFGDSMNDASLLETAQYGIAMGNGADELKQLADYITLGVDQDGIIHALKHFELL